MKSPVVLITLLAILLGCSKGGITPDTKTDLLSTKTNFTLELAINVIYSNDRDPKQYVSQERLKEIINGVNEYYSDKFGGYNTKIKFSIAKVEYTKWTEQYPIDYEEIMENETRKYIHLLSDPNKYINILLYNFKRVNNSKTALGISHLPYTMKDNALKGLTTVTTQIPFNNLKFAYCTSINSLYINSKDGSNTSLPRTIAHELGHYLGLYHVFAEDNNGFLNNATDTDYCIDTQSYNRKTYETEYENIVKTQPQNNTLAYLAKRKDGNNVEFTSYNLMDYYVSYLNRFTKDQFERMKHVILNSPLIPTNNRTTKSTNTPEAPSGVIDLPIRTIK